MRQDTQLEALRQAGPAIQLTFLAGPDVVPVKLVPAIQGALKLSNQWLREDLTHLSDWWGGDLADEKRSFLRKVAALQEVGPELVAKGGFWRLSFSHAETVLLKDVDADGGQRKAALRLLKFVNNTRWMPEYGRVLSSYHLKTVLLWCCEIYPQKAQWETLLSSVQNLLRILTHTLTKGNLPHYFLRPVNLFGKRYQSSPTTYGPLALQALCHEAEVMLVDVVGYLLPDDQPGVHCVSEDSEKMAALQEFKERHREELKELKKMEEERMYEEVEVGEG
uniref:protein mab-21-like 3 n=1 Tax=Euleptes europaea TaxID=460621 RepID=UPI0025403F69|nr:protein mab-21-like 3 [Euleptes europaea]